MLFISGGLFPGNTVVVVDLPTILIIVIGSAGPLVARRFFELLLANRHDVAVKSSVVFQHVPWKRIAIRSYAEETTELEGGVANST